MQQAQQNARVKKENPTHLSTIITSLLSAFESTRHLYQRIKNDTHSSAKKLNKRSPSISDAAATPQTREERELQLHLQRAPRRIAKIFKTNSERLGEGYRRGDERAKTSINRILLVLNTGLTRIISTLLRKKNTAVDNDDIIRELMSLSERSARDSVTELEGFRMRLESMSSLALSGGGGYSSVGQGSAVVRGRRRYHPRVQPASVEEEVDGRKGSSTSQIGGARTTVQGTNVNKKKSTMSDTSKAAKRTTTPKRTKALQEIHPVWVRSKNSSTTSIHLRRINKRPKPSEGDDQTRSRSQPPHTTTAIVNSTPELGLQPASTSTRHRPPDLQTQISHAVRAEILLDRRISMLSHSSGSTKLGEIPQHKWINQWVPPIEVDEESEEEDGHEGGGNEDSGRTGIRFWRRFGRNRT